MKDFDNLPFKEVINKKMAHWKYREYKLNGVSFYKLLERLLKNNTGKSFDMTFHYFCSTFPKWYQKDFLSEFHNHYISYNYGHWYVDKLGLIQISYEKRKPLYRIYSDDYKVVYRNKKNNNIGDYLNLQDAEKNYNRVQTGWFKDVESKKDPEFIAYNKRKQRLLAIERNKRKNNKEVIYSFKTKSEIEKSSKIDILKRNAAGFDEQSFKGDGYHGRKNKK